MFLIIVIMSSLDENDCMSRVTSEREWWHKEQRGGNGSGRGRGSGVRDIIGVVEVEDNNCLGMFQYLAQVCGDQVKVEGERVQGDE